MVGPDPHLGTVLHGRYLVSERVAEGAMAVVYRGERVGLKRQVAIKFLHESYASSEDGMRRFEVEARAMSRLAHPNCVAVTDYGLDNGAPYLVMDFVPGRSLRDLLEDDVRLPPARAVAVVRQVLAGLTHAHGQGIVHRDVKPENIVVSSVEGHGEQVRILDFGLAKLRNENSVTSGLAVGTPGYMSPEQTVGERVDERADLYATGIILFELLVGRKPFEAESPFDVMRMHREAAVPAMAVAAPDVSISPELESVVRRALAKSRTERFATAGAFLQALESAPEAEGPEVANVRTGGRAFRVLLAASTAVVLAAGSAAAVVWVLNRHSERGAASPAPALPAPRAAAPAEPPSAEPEPAPAPTAPDRAEIRASADSPTGPAASSSTPTNSSPHSGSPESGTPPSARPTPSADAPPDPGAANPAPTGLPPERVDVTRMRARAAGGDPQGAARALKRLRARDPDRADVYYALGNLYAELNGWRPSVDYYARALRLEPAYRSDPRLISDVVEALASDRAHERAAEILADDIGRAAVPRLEQAMRSASPRQRVRAKRVRDDLLSAR